MQMASLSPRDCLTCLLAVAFQLKDPQKNGIRICVSERGRGRRQQAVFVCANMFEHFWLLNLPALSLMFLAASLKILTANPRRFQKHFEKSDIFSSVVLSNVCGNTKGKINKQRNIHMDRVHKKGPSDCSLYYNYSWHMTGITFNPQSLSWLSIYALHWAPHVCLTCPRSSFGVSHIVTSPDI